MISFVVFTVFWLAGGAALGHSTASLKRGLRVIGSAAVIWGLVVGFGVPAPHGVLAWWEVGGIAALHLLLMFGLGFAAGRGLKGSRR